MYTRRRRRVLGLFGASILALSALLLLAPASQSLAVAPAALLASKTATPTSTTAPTATTAQSTVTPAPTSAPTPVGQTDHPKLNSAGDCANPPKPSGTNPFIQYCSPSFGGNVEGPWGSHVVFTVNAAGQDVQQIYIFEVSPAASDECSPTPNPDLTFQNGSTPELGTFFSGSNHAAVNLTFNWTFPTIHFSTTLDYCLAMALRGGSVIVSKTGFSLLTLNPPCVAVAVGDKTPDCSGAQNEPLNVLQGQTITIAGKNWLPGDQKLPIQVTLHCAPQTTCTGGSPDTSKWLIKGSGSDDVGGIWKLDKVTVPDNVAGQFDVQAVMVDKAITFGDASLGDAQTFTLDVLPHPCVGVSAGGTCAWSRATNNASQSAAQGKYITVSGNNWQPTSTVSVYLLSGSLDESECAAQRPKTSAGVSQFSALSGSVNGQVLLPTKAKVGDKYTICASGPSPASGSSDPVYAAVHINITKGATHQPFSLLSLLGLLFALIGGGVWLLTMPKRAVVPQPVGRRQ